MRARGWELCAALERDAKGDDALVIVPSGSTIAAPDDLRKLHDALAGLGAAELECASFTRSAGGLHASDLKLVIDVALSWSAKRKAELARRVALDADGDEDSDADEGHY